jgi:hypothetical protein
VQKLKMEMQATEAGLREAAAERERLLAEAEEVKRHYLLAQDTVEEEQSVVMRMRVRTSHLTRALSLQTLEFYGKSLARYNRPQFYGYKLHEVKPPSFVICAI